MYSISGFQFLLFIFFPLLSIGQNYEHPGGMHSSAQLTFVKQQIQQENQPYLAAYQQLLALADEALDHEQHALSDFNVPGFYIDSALHRANSRSLQSDAFDAYACALAYQLSGEEKYARKALAFLMAWASINTNYSNHDGSLVMAYSGTAMINAAELMLPYPGWQQQEKETFFLWAKNVYRRSANEIRDRQNNWADWGRLGSMLVAHLLDDQDEMDENISLIKSDLFHKIAPDGHMPEEVRRGKNGIWYTYFSLAPITAACWVAYQSEGTDLFAYEKDGVSLKTALNYLYYFNQHPEHWTWQENPRTGTADSWPGNLFAAMRGIYDDKRFGQYVAEAEPLVYSKHHFAWTFPSLMPSVREGIHQADADLEALRDNFRAELRALPLHDEAIPELVNSLAEGGSWPDINYKDVSRTGFEHSEHLNRMLVLSSAYQQPESDYFQDPGVKQAISQSLDFWLENDFICENWWWNQIGTPDRLTNVLLVMDDALSEQQLLKAAPIIGRADLHAWGARPGGDRIKIARIYGKYALFTRSTTTLQEAVRTMNEEIHFAYQRGDSLDRRGLQTDFSFHHRSDRVTSTLSYGLGYADSFADWAEKLAGTSYQFSDDAMHLLVDFFLDGICKTSVYGKYPDPGAKNRSISRRGTLKAFEPDLPRKLLSATEYRAAEMEQVAAIREGKAEAEMAFNKFFWHTEYMSHQRPAYFTSVRMFSSRNHSMEVPYNGEGLLNHHLGDGANFITQRGDEYLDIFPVWDWQKIPGTTVVQKPALPDENDIQQKGLTAFVGGVTDGSYGAAVFDFKSSLDSLQARKAWFFFDDAYVCLSSGISAEEPYPVATTLNQAYLRGDVFWAKRKKPLLLKKGAHQLRKAGWLYHDSIAYIFPESATVHLENQSVSGSWKRINRQFDSAEGTISHDVFKLWLDHGVAPENAGYAYIVVPGIALEAVQNYRQNQQILILENSEKLQAVMHQALGMMQLAFYEAGSFQLPDGRQLIMESPGLLMLSFADDQLKQISVSDPGRSMHSLSFSIAEVPPITGENFRITDNSESGLSKISIQLPQGEYAGKSVTIALE